MPYITEERIEQIEQALDGYLSSVGITARTPGDLNYILTQIILGYLENKDKIDYAALNEVMGVIESCKHEFYRRVIAPYEEKKKEENGDVY